MNNTRIYAPRLLRGLAYGALFSMPLYAAMIGLVWAIVVHPWAVIIGGAALTIALIRWQAWRVSRRERPVTGPKA